MKQISPSAVTLGVQGSHRQQGQAAGGAGTDLRLLLLGTLI
jgi:hypothetical protein